MANEVFEAARSGHATRLSKLLASSPAVAWGDISDGGTGTTPCQKHAGAATGQLALRRRLSAPEYAPGSGQTLSRLRYLSAETTITAESVAKVS